MITEYARVLLQPRSLFIMSKDARFDYRHGITKSKVVKLDSEIDSNVCVRDEGYRRISLTIRKLLDTRRKASDDQLGWFDVDPLQGQSKCDC